MAGGDLGRAFRSGRTALIAYLMAGYPTRAASLEAMRIVASHGADLIELGVPFSDPIADGPVIQEAATEARRAAGGSFGLAETIDLAAEFRTRAPASESPPIALMTYLNPMMRQGLPRVAELARAAGVGGFIVPDMPPDSATPWLRVSAGLDTVFLVAPTSTPERLAKVGEASSGFVYCVSTTGVTGERSQLPDELGALVERVRASTTLPVAVGFGVSTREHAEAVARIADGVVVGSAIVRRQGEPAELAEFVASLGEAVRSAA